MACSGTALLLLDLFFLTSTITVVVFNFASEHRHKTSTRTIKDQRLKRMLKSTIWYENSNVVLASTKLITPTLLYHTVGL
jgi:hypothetical protein